MGCCSPNQQLKYELTQQIKLFDFNVKQNAEFTIQMRAQREIWGATKDMIKNLEIAYQGLMVQNAFYIKRTSAKILGGGVKGKFAAPPLVDIYWQETILYSVKYQEFCTRLVGGIIDRDEITNYASVNKKLLKNILPDYNYKTVREDGESFVWILQKDIQSIVQLVYQPMILKVNKDSQLKMTKNVLAYLDTIIRNALDKSKENKIVEQDPPLEIHDFNQMKADLPKNLEYIFKNRYCQSNAKAYIDEYLKFMYLLKFSQFQLTPSEEVDLVWHTHQHCTVNYRQFTRKYVGRFIHHHPTTGGTQSAQLYDDQYSKTLTFYHEKLKRAPPQNLWPPVNERFNPINYIGFWVSIRRLIFAIVRVIEQFTIQQILTEDQVFNLVYASYQSWMGADLMKKGDYIVKHKAASQEQQPILQQSQIGSQPQPIFWVAGGCGIYDAGMQFSVASLHHDAGCNGGCNVGCGANDGGGCGGGGGHGGGGCGGGDGGGGCGGGGCGGGGCGGGGCGGGGCGGCGG